MEPRIGAIMIERIRMRVLVPAAALAALGLGVAGGCAGTPDAGGSAASASAQSSRQPDAPRARRQPVVTELHGDTREDPYAWLRNKTQRRTIAYLEAENAYAESVMAGTADLQQRLYDDMLSRIQESDLSAPYRKGRWWYYTRTEEGMPYPVYCRKLGTLDARERVLLDGNAMAEGQEYFRVGTFNVSPDGWMLAYSTDTTGGEQYTMRFRDLRTGRELPDTIAGTYYGSAWASDNTHLFYVTVDDAMRPYQLWRHALGTDASEDVLVYTEEDERFFLSVRRARSGAFLIVELESNETSESLILASDEPLGEWSVFEPREQSVEYTIDHAGDRFYAITNAGGATNFKLVSTAEYATTSEHWEEILAHDPEVYLTGLACFRGHMAISARERGVPVIKVRSYADGLTHTIAQPEPAYSAGLRNNAEFDTTTLRYAYSSPVTPPTVFDYDVATRRRTVVKETPVPNYDRDLYRVELIEVEARDGAVVPLTLVMRRDLDRSAPAPLLLRGYGSYGSSYSDRFRSSDLVLLDRGFIVGVAHVRGGSEKGRLWYEQGRMMNKMNTFTDFIDCAESLIESGYTSPDLLAAQGGSAGGLLMGAAVNMAPDTFGAVIANVPFVDVINTMLDETIPLTVIEWEEWGNPHIESEYRYILQYSPYDNVEAKDYPHMLITAGLNDPRVAYWEPAKWCARLRHLKTDDNTLLLKTNMGAGHGGASGRYERLRERAFEYAFILEHIGSGEETGQ